MLRRKFQTILVIPPPGPVDVHAYRFLDNAIRAAHWLSARLTVAASAVEYRDLYAYIERQTGEPIDWSPVPSKATVVDLLEAAMTTKAHLLVMPSIPTHDTEPEAAVERPIQLLQQSPIPVLLLPRTTKLGKYPFACVVVPMSGEVRYSPALDTALALARQRHAPVEIIHVTERQTADIPPPRERGVCGDQSHHEYPSMIETLIAEGSPFSTAEDRAFIQRFHHFYGTVDEVLLREAMATPRPLVVAEWHGSLAEGRAGILKALLQSGSLPLLLVKTRKRAEADLRVGGHFNPHQHRHEHHRRQST